MAVCGAGKTLAVVREVFDLLQKYPDIAIISNLELNFKGKYMYFFSDMESFFASYVSCVKNDKPCGIVVIIDEIQLFIEKLIATKNVRLLTVLSQSRKLHTYILGTTQLYNKVPKDIRDYIRTNGQIVFVERHFYISFLKYVNMNDCVENSRLELIYKINKLDWFVHSQELYSLYNTFDIVSPVLDLINKDEKLPSNSG